ncbi:hypothetical protein [Selenihalanaerobacter shriftii]|uniref:Uncharacterized protein n=1 Tax=Selenihalanaerobacter shriftii TaxID=142842 RepID=A0A1T4QSK4_9FIRM|nr:hypothetical protein [Selenihalanaerobacter shriftii]SKA06759.1 hypothetical protein SAMN02745118_02680 [Selenihalanaerobacter shriftii]
MTNDFNDITQTFTSLTNSYRLFVGAAEELTRTPSVPEEIIEDAIVRSAKLGSTLDLLLLFQILSILTNNRNE